jgi:hypothetical protein
MATITGTSGALSFQRRRQQGKQLSRAFPRGDKPNAGTPARKIPAHMINQTQQWPATQAGRLSQAARTDAVSSPIIMNIYSFMRRKPHAIRA